VSVCSRLRRSRNDDPRLVGVAWVGGGEQHVENCQHAGKLGCSVLPWSGHPAGEITLPKGARGGSSDCSTATGIDYGCLYSDEPDYSGAAANGP
jgi:hypothetical protein